MAILALTVLPVHAWDALAHRTIAELAWRQMSPAQRKAASDLLRQHPHYRILLAVDVPAGVDSNEWAFLNAAIWPDRVRPAKRGEPPKPRSITKYDKYPHAIGYPFLRPGDTNSALLDKFFIARPDAEMVLSNSLATLRNPKASAHDRAVSLCWTLHLCGDLHQPLHAANLVTKDKPKGYGLGGSFIVRDQHGEQVNLHIFWDRIFGMDLSYAGVTSLADELAAAPELQRAALTEYGADKTIASWVQESFHIAVDFAYAEDHVQYVLAGALASGAVAPSAIPALKADYIREARAISRRRLALAAWRLTDELKETWRAGSSL